MGINGRISERGIYSKKLLHFGGPKRQNTLAARGLEERFFQLCGCHHLAHLQHFCGKKKFHNNIVYV
jgi:hypothetical protein